MKNVVLIAQSLAITGALVAQSAKPIEKTAPSPQSAAQISSKLGNWTTVGGDTGHTKYSALKQITTDNVTKLTKIWSYDAGGGELTPIVIDGIMYYPSGHLVVCLDGTTGKQVWKTDLSTLIPSAPGSQVNDARAAGFTPRGGPGAGGPGAPGGSATSGNVPGTSSTPPSAAPTKTYLTLGNSSKYGLAYWPGTVRTGSRLVLTTSAGYLIQLDAKTGELIKDFGKDGALDLRVNAMEKFPYSDYTPGMLPTL